MAEQKMTQKMWYEQIIKNYALTKEEKEFLESRIAQLEKKNSTKSGKPTKEQAENIALMDSIYEEMEIGKRYTITEMLKALPSCSTYTNQKISALMRKMKDEGRVEKTEEKGKSYFSKVEVDED